MSNKASASNCFTSADALNGSPISGSFPRQSSNRDASAGCGNTGSAHIFLSTYYSTATGGPGSTLNTPQASLTIFFIGNPGPSSAIQLDVNVAFCMYGAVSRPVYILNGTNLIGTQVGAGTTSVSLAGSSFVDDSVTYGTINGQPIYRYSRPVILAVDTNAPRNCEVTANVSSGALLTFSEDKSPGVALGGNGARPNQNTYGTQAGARYIVPSNVGNLNNNGYGAFAIRTLANGTDAVEYTIPFAPSCSVPASGQLIYLRIYDADAPNPANPPGTTNGSFNGGSYYPRMEIIDYDASGNYLGTIDPTGNSNQVVVGNDEYGEYPFVVRAGHKYAWRWWNVSAKNGLQVWMPFSEITARPGASCPHNQPPTANMSISCVAAGATARVSYTINRSDPDGDPVSLVGANINGIGIGSWSGSVNVGYSTTVQGHVVVSDGTAQAGPFDSNTVTCPANQPPTGTYSASCQGVTRQLKIDLNLYDPDGGNAPITVRATGPPYNNGVILTSNGSFVSPTNYAAPIRDSVTYTVSFTIQDSATLAPSTWTVNYMCYRDPTVVTCNITSSGLLEPGEQLTPSVQVTAAPVALNGTITYHLRNSGVDVAGSPKSVTKNPLGSPAGTTYTAPDFTPIALPSIGAYTQDATLALTRVVPDDPASVTCGGGATVSVANEPYFKVIGGDIISNNRVKGWNKIGKTYTVAPNDGSGKSGSGAQGLIVATNVIDGVMSGDMLTINYAGGTPKNLTLANLGTSAPVLPQFGGGFGGIAFTMPTTDASATAWIAGSTSTGSFRYAGSTSYSGAIANKTRMTVDLTGDLTINGNITYSGATGGYPTVDDIPHIKFIVRKDPSSGVGGHIFIQPSVGRIDAELVAEVSIDTCSTPFANKYDGCSNVPAPALPTLIVNGSLAAPSLQLNKMIGTVRNSTATDGTRTGPGTYQNSGNISEIIQFTPELFMATPAEKTTSLGNTYDAVTALPPLF